ncbi:M15 family metallopeptidase [Marinimicrobium sp. ABcell2]|uniref:M15 family metallopeptidase n=1 Tax=Marinimicrobium sp. ABcell2 TaxID=3069751 RepID=UPI0027B65430|nr:M15 family metallopeptidase [Marinimicrobium sp. ABcell2]MDQ2078489.1 M15 family metallopeptidase [Marinimicrobium sp. ABcell2]
MKRRDVLAGILGGVGFTAGNACLWHLADKHSTPAASADSGHVVLDDDPYNVMKEGLKPVQIEPETVIRATVGEATDLPDSAYVKAAQPEALKPSTAKLEGGLKPEQLDKGEPPVVDTSTDLLDKVRNFDGDFVDDVYLTEAERPTLHSLFLRFENAEKVIGHGNFNLLSFDKLFQYGRNFSQIGRFTKPEFALIDKLFFTEAENYGFFGRRVTTELTARIPVEDTVKIPRSGHFLLKGDATSQYEKLQRDIGDSIILTSGIRGNVKQMHLFVAKCLSSNYNLSRASRSLAPPGHSYHGIGDFDVGRVGWGYANFTDKFAQTDEFKRMQDLGYVRIRYTQDNRFGVRFEPWHIKVV